MTVRRWLALVLTLAVAVLPGCTPPVERAEWRQVEGLPAGFQAETLASAGERLIIGGRTAEPFRPMLLITESATVREVPLTPDSAYGKTANLTSLAVAGDHLYAIGGDRGGAHGNVRWSVWAGDESAVREREQEFWTFGGQDAGSLTTIVATPDGPMIIGNWGSPYGLDITVWTVRNETWTRHDSRGSALASTSRELLTERAAAVINDRVIIAGKVLDLGGSLVPRAATWTRTGAETLWRRVDLPSSGTASSALDLACAEDCLIAGVIDGRLAAWTGNGSEWRPLDVPDLEADEQSVIMRAYRLESGWRIAVGRQGNVMIIDPDTGESVPGPTGRLIDAAGVGSQTYLIVEDQQGSRAVHHLAH